MQVIGYNKAFDGTVVIDYDARSDKDYVGSMTIEEFEVFQKARPDAISVVIIDEEKYELYKSARKKAKDYIRKYSLFLQKKI